MVDDCLKNAGVKHLVGRGIAGVADNTIFEDFEKWESDKFWPPVKEAFSGDSSNTAQTLDIDVSLPPTAAHLIRDVNETLVLPDLNSSKGASAVHWSNCRRLPRGPTHQHPRDCTKSGRPLWPIHHLCQILRYVPTSRHPFAHA